VQNNPVPHNPEAERVLIGSILRHPDDFPTLSVEPGDFHDLRHKAAWAALSELYAAGNGIDLFTVAEKCGSEVDPEYLADLEGGVPWGHDPHDSAAIVREMAARRRIFQAASEMARAAFDLETNIGEVSGAMAERLATNAAPKFGAVHWATYIDRLMEEVEAKSKDPTATWGIPTGFPGFDQITGGIQPGELLILSGKPGVGKSLLAMQMAVQLARNAPGAIYSIEMSGLQVARRLVSGAAGIQTSKLKSGELNNADWEAFRLADAELRKLPVYMSDAAGWNTADMRADLARLKLRHGISWFLVDYLLLMTDLDGENESTRAGAISRGLKLTCRHLDLGGIVIHSLTKGANEKDDEPPKLSNLRGSYQVGFDADLACFLTEFQVIGPGDNGIRPTDRANMRTLLFAKGRELEDPRKYIHFVKKPGFPTFAEYYAEPVGKNGKVGIYDR